MYVKVAVTANSRIESIEPAGPNRFKITVTVPAKNNLANKRVRELVAEYLGVAVGAVRIINGHHSPSKLLSIQEK